MKQLALALDPMPPPAFRGASFIPHLDHDRLETQHRRIKEFMLRDGAWHSLAEIAEATGDPPASVSAQLRFLRRAEFGGYVVEKRRCGDPRRGRFEYRVREVLRG